MSKSWKEYERRLCLLFGGRRRGSDFRNRTDGGGKDDCIGTGQFSVEGALLKRPSYGEMFAKARQAEINAPQGSIPVAVIKKNSQGVPDRDALVVFRLETFLKHFVCGGDNGGRLTDAELSQVGD